VRVKIFLRLILHLRVFGEEKRGTNLEEKGGALHEGLIKTLESLRRILRLV
jgi:hypothetical protein